MRTFVSLVASAALVLGLSTVAATAAPLPVPSTPKAAPTATPALAKSLDKKCTLSPSLTHSGGDVASCISVGATLSSVPTVGQTATLTIRVEAARPEPTTKVTVDLPSTFVFTDGTVTTRAVTGSGTVARATIATLDMAAGQTRTLTGTVKAVGSGFGAIVVSANNRLSRLRTDGGTDSVFVTTGTSAKTTFPGAAKSLTAASTHTTVRSSRASGGPERPSSAPSRTAPVSVSVKGARIKPAVIKPQTAGTSCATGTWNFVDQTGVSRPAANTLVEVLNSSNTLLSYAVSGGDGSYTICWSTGGASTSVYVKFLESNNIWQVTDNSNNVYSFSTGIVAVPDGTTQNFGSLYPGSSSYYPALHTFAIANDEWQWVHQYFGGQCWSPYISSCHQLVIHWQSDSTTGTYWNTSGVYLLAGSPDTVDEPAHEIGHNLMWELYGQNYPATTNCSPHYLFTVSSTTCGWTEGWADWVATSVYNNTTWTFNGGSTTSFDTTWGDGQDTGDQVEGRIVQAMRSLTDGTKAPWDNDPGEGAGVRDNRNFFAVLNTYRPNTFADVWSDRAALGQDTSQTALSALYEGTIDYGFRNPLSDYAGAHFPEAVPSHNYSHTTTTGYWSVVAEKPDGGSDTDLYLYNDFAQSSLLASSAYGSTTTDFVGINSNTGHRALQTYYPQVRQFAGSGGYTIEEAQGTNVLTAGSSPNYLYATQPVRVWDSYQTSGVPVYYRAVPSGGQDVQLASLSADQDLVARSGAVTGADPGPGAAASLVVTPTASGYAGLVLLNNGLTAGTVTVYADTTAPTGGTISINSGAATTHSRTVSLTLSATDTQTGIDQMQISTDGTFDTEPVVPYSTTGTATLPGASGTKTVYVRYLNNAGIWSTPVSDTINLTLAPAITAVTPNGGPLAGGNTVTITGTDFTGATAVKFSTTAATSYTVVSSTKITAVVPAHAAGLVNVRVTTASGTSPAVTADYYTYENAPTITAITPNGGPAAGATSVTITGTNFTGATAVKFSSTAATSYTVVSSTKITAVVPAHAAGLVNVRVTTASGTSPAVTADYYTYENAPTITAITPNGGPPAGGNTVTITGTNFTGATAVKFSSTAATSYTVVSSTKITAVVPAHAAGTVNIYVTTPSGHNAAVTADYYTYQNAPTITAITPNGGPLAGGKTVTITGTNFTGATAVKFSSTAATSFTVVSSTKITAVTPAHAAGLVNTYVTTPSGTSTAVTADYYTYQNAPTITAITPTSGPAAGGTSVTITGTNFTGATAVKFSSTAATSFTVVSGTKITAVTPAHAAGLVNTYVTTASGTSTAVTADRYTYT